VCYAYLADVLYSADNQEQLQKSNWFTRGWTLQELIAPFTVIFLNQEWQEIGTKLNLREQISEITGIPQRILEGDNLESASIAQRMSWASKRKTGRVEDRAYSLLGIFGINMPMLYGEGERAFFRLQQEIMKISDDYSIFAWRSNGDNNLLASSPDAFAQSSQIVPLSSNSASSGVITENNKGYLLKLLFIEGRWGPKKEDLAILPCANQGSSIRLGIILRDISPNGEGGYFERAYPRIEEISGHEFRRLNPAEKLLCIRRERQTQKSQLPLLEVGEKGDTKVVRLLLRTSNCLESKTTSGRTLLSTAAGWGNETVVKLLINKEAEIESKCESGMTPLSYAAQNGQTGVVELLLREGAEIESKSNTSQTPLSYAARNGEIAVAELLLRNGANIESKSNNRRTPLSYVAECGKTAVAEFLLGKGANVESKCDTGRTPLSYAAQYGQAEVVELLLREGAEIESKSNTSQTPLSYAAQYGKTAVAELLLEEGANIKSKSNAGRTPLSYAAQYGKTAVAELLLRQGANIESESDAGRMPLSYAAEHGKKGMVKLLLKKGALPGFAEKKNRNPRFWALKNNHHEIADILSKASL